MPSHRSTAGSVTLSVLLLASLTQSFCPPPLHDHQLGRSRLERRKGSLHSDTEAAQASELQQQGAPHSENEKRWNFRGKWSVFYREEGSPDKPALLLLPGFGVGTFHFEKNLSILKETHQVYTLDFLGQGKSWPHVPPTAEDGLSFSVDMWREQVSAFLEEVVKRPAYLAGNSLGGYLSVYVGAVTPDLVKGIVLLNATPFWAFNPSTKPLLWDGTLPAPKSLFTLGSFYFDIMRKETTVKTMLGAVYANKASVDDQLVEDIIAGTTRGASNHDYGVGGHETFTSILFSPKAGLSFEEMLTRLTCPVALVYGKEDPWIVPLWAQKVKRLLPEVLYYQISPSGHCPHHETPAAVNALISGWIAHVEGGSPAPLTTSSSSNRSSSSSSNSSSSSRNSSGSGMERGLKPGEEPCLRMMESAGDGEQEVEVRLMDGSPRTLLEKFDLWWWQVNRGEGADVKGAAP